MIETVVLVIFALVVTEFYARTRRPKLYAFLNTALGVGSFVLWHSMGGAVDVTAYSGAVSSILGVFGTIFLYIVGMGG